MKIMVRLISWFLALWFSLSGAALSTGTGTAYAQEQESPSESATETTVEADPAGIEKRLGEVTGILQAALAEENEQAALQLGVTLGELQQRTGKLRDLEAAYQRQLTSLKRRGSLNQEEASLKGRLEAEIQGLVPETPPYTLTQYDKVLGQLSASRQQEKAASDKIDFLEKWLGDSRTAADLAGQELRKIRETAETGKAGEKDPLLAWQLGVAKLDHELAEVTVTLQKLLRANGEQELRIARLNTQIAQKSVDWVKSHLFFDQGDLNKHLEGLQERRAELQSRMETLLREQHGVEQKWLESQGALARTTGENEAERAVATAFLEARKAWRDTYQKVLEQTENMIRILNLEEQVWQRRYTLLAEKVPYTQLDLWNSEGEAYLERFEKAVYLTQSDQAGMQSEMASIEKQLAQEGLDPMIRQHVETRVSALRRVTERNSEFLSILLEGRELVQHLIDETSSRKATVSLSERLQGLRDRLQSTWDFELWVIDGRPVTVRKVVVALLILIIGMIVFRWFSRRIGNRLSSLKRLDQSSAAAIQKLLYYATLVLLILFALRIVNIPLTVFTLFGGAIAIGVGFGAQNLINNFISGFIIMMERPVKIGDVIEVESNYGVIEEIGARATRIRTAGNVHLLVPNSSFLEKNVVNWTLSDQRIRTNVTVGLMYGSETRKVKELMLEAATTHGKVLKDKEPFVLFNDFGDNALIFDVYFWIRVRRPMERRMIESDIRFRIDKLFRAAGLVVAFPQRDIHLDTSRPLDLRILGPENEPHGENPPDQQDS